MKGGSKSKQHERKEDSKLKELEEKRKEIKIKKGKEREYFKGKRVLRKEKNEIN